MVDEALLAAAGTGLCERLRAMLEASGADAAVIDVAALADPDVGTVDALARVLLTARRLGRDVRLRHVSRRLCELLAFVGLDELVSPTGRGFRGRGEWAGRTAGTSARCRGRR